MNEGVQDVLLSETPAALMANCSHSDKRWWWCYWFPLLALTAGWSWPPGWQRRSVWSLYAGVRWRMERLTRCTFHLLFLILEDVQNWCFSSGSVKKKTWQHRSTTRPLPPCRQKHWVKEGVQHLATCLLTHSLSSLCSDKMLGRQTKC